MDEQLGPEELEEVLRSKGAHSSAVVLESVSITFTYIASTVRFSNLMK